MEPKGSLPHSEVLTHVAILSKLEPVPTTTSHLQKIHLNIILPSTSGSPKWSLIYCLISFIYQLFNDVFSESHSTCLTELQVSENYSKLTN
jgi:hypothetical protein